MGLPIQGCNEELGCGQGWPGAPMRFRLVTGVLQARGSNNLSRCTYPDFDGVKLQATENAGLDRSQALYTLLIDDNGDPANGIPPASSYSDFIEFLNPAVSAVTDLEMAENIRYRQFIFKTTNPDEIIGFDVKVPNFGFTRYVKDAKGWYVEEQVNGFNGKQRASFGLAIGKETQFIPGSARKNIVLPAGFASNPISYNSNAFRNVSGSFCKAPITPGTDGRTIEGRPDSWTGYSFGTTYPNIEFKAFTCDFDEINEVDGSQEINWLTLKLIVVGDNDETGGQGANNLLETNCNDAGVIFNGSIIEVTPIYCQSPCQSEFGCSDRIIECPEGYYPKCKEDVSFDEDNNASYTYTWTCEKEVRSQNPRDPITYDYTDPITNLPCPGSGVQAYLVSNCEEPQEQFRITFSESNVETINLNRVYTFKGSDFSGSEQIKCFRILSLDEVGQEQIKYENVEIEKAYAPEACAECIADNKQLKIYTITSCETGESKTISLSDINEVLSIGRVYSFDFDLSDFYEVISYNFTDLADFSEVNVLQIADETGCDFFKQCLNLTSCKTGQIITVKFENDLNKTCNIGDKYIFTGVEGLSNDAWDCLGNTFCSEDAIVVNNTASNVRVVECDNCSVGYSYYKLTDCKEGNTKYIYADQDLIEGKVYTFKEEPSTGYLAEKQQASCADDIENLKVYSFEDVQDVFDSCEQFNKTCYGLVDCETGNVTVSSNDDLAFYVGKVIKWIDPNDPDKIEKCASVEEFNCYEEGYVDVTGLDYETCSFLGEDIIFVDKQGTIDSIESEAPNPYGNTWEYIGDTNCILKFSRSLIPDAEETVTVFKFEIDEDNNLQSYGSVVPPPSIEYKYVPGIKAQPVDDVQIEPKDCFDDTEEGCKECTFVEQKDCISESQLENSKVICIDFKGLCNDSYANLFDFLTLGNNEETEYEALLKQLPSKPISTQNKVYALFYDMLSDKQCYDTIRTSSGQFIDSSGVTGFVVTLLKSIEFTSDEFPYIKDLIDSVYGYLNSLAVVYQKFIVDYYTWENADYSEELTPEIFKKTVLNYTNKNGELLSIPFSKGMTVLLDYKKPYYFSNDDYVGNLDYNEFLLSKMQITEEACGLDLVKVECSPNDKLYEKGFFIFGLNFGEDPSWNITEDQLRNAWSESEYFNTSICPNLPIGTQIEDIESTYRMLLDKAYSDQTSIVSNDITGRPYVGYPDEPLVIYYPEATQCNTLYYSPTGPNTRFTNVKVVMEKKTHFPSVLRFDCDDISQLFDGAPANWNILEFQTLQGLPIPGNVEDIVFALDESIPKPGTYYWNEVNYEWTLQIGNSIDNAVFSNAAFANTFAQELIELGKSLHDLNVIGYDIMTYRLKRFYGI